MKHNKLCTVTVCLLVLLAFGATAQKTKTQKPVKKTVVQKPPAKKPATEKVATGKVVGEKPKAIGADAGVNAAEDEKKVRDIIAFLEFMLNTLGVDHPILFESF